MKRWLAVLTIMIVGSTFLSAYAQTETDAGNGWLKIDTGGETMCSDGSPYNFWAHPGSSDDLLIFFQGGGACWNDAMCADGAGLTYVNTIGAEIDDAPGYPVTAPGIFDFENAENPFKDYTVVSIPYCTGDVHMGSTDVTYAGRDGDVTIHHRGFTNASAVLDWVYENYGDPEDVFIGGCSAGGYGAIFHAPYIMEQYADTATTITHLSDSSVGVIPENVEFEGFDQWGMAENVAEWLPNAEALGENFNSVAFYTSLAEQYPEHTFAQYTTTFDNVQVLFYHLQGITDWTARMGVVLLERSKAEEVSAPAWSAGMNDQLATLNETIPNFSSFVAGGSEHCIYDRDILYTYSANGTRFVDWLAELTKGDPVEDVACASCDVAEAVGN